MNKRILFSIFFSATLFVCLADINLADISLDTSVRQSKCASRCTFRACKLSGVLDDLRPSGTTVLIRDHRVASTPFLCLPGLKLGRILLTGEALVTPVKGGGAFVPISSYQPLGLRPRYPKNYFGLSEISFPPLPGKYGISHVPSSGNQFETANDICVLIPIQRYELFRADGSLRTVNTNDLSDCISYRVRAPKLLIELSWDSSDDLELIVREPQPSSFVISNDNMNAPSGGRLINDHPLFSCTDQQAGREQVRYLQDHTPPSGEYTVLGRHFENCGKGPTAWNVAVVYNGVRFASGRGRSNTFNDKKSIFKITFTI